VGRAIRKRSRRFNLIEQWKPIAGFEAYEVSNMGRVRRAVPGNGTQAGKILKQRVLGSGYLYVSLSIHNRVTLHAVHRLVAEAFISNSQNLPDVNHKDGVKTHNLASNLEWRTRVGNLRHATKLGLSGRGGVTLDKRRGTWIAKYSPEPYKVVWLGSFKTKREALAAHKEAVRNLPDIL